MRKLRSLAVAGLVTFSLATSCDVPPEEDGTEVVEGEATVPSSFVDSAYASGLTNPTAMAFAPDGRLFVAQQGGALRVIKSGSLLSTPFLQVSVDTQGERGLLGVAFDPSFSTNHFVYVYYTSKSGSIHNRVSRFTANGDVATSGSEKVLLELPTLNAIYHNGGALNFGADGKLYIAVGDNKTGSPAQSTGSLWGKILRINADGTIPTDNPWYSTASGNNRAIWARGFRNPFTFDVQPGTGRIFVNDVGEATWEEIDDLTKGANYGWPNSEGNTSNSGEKSPFATYGSRSSSPAGATNCAIVGAGFYNPSTVKYPSDYIGDYFYADYCGKTIWRIDSSTKSKSTFATGTSSVVDLEVGNDGYLYYLQRGGTVRRVTYSGTVSQPPTITDQPASKTVSVGQSATFTVGASGSGTLTYQWQRNGANISGATGTSFTLASAQTADSGAGFRCVVKNSVGTATSNTATLTVTTNKAPTAAITAPVAGTLYKGGQTITYSGKGTDPEDGTLAASQMTWQVDFHHDTHIHPFILATTGSTGGSFVVPVDNEVSPNVWYRILLTVKDKGGLTNQTFVDVKPTLVNFTLASNPTGLQLTLDGQPFTAPKTVTGVVGINRQIGVVTPQTLSGVTYAFSSWSDGKSATHTISTPSTATTYTATFTKSTAKIYEAENALLSGAVVANTKTGFTGTGYADYINASADFVEWTVNAATAGTYTLTFRFANGSTATRSLAIKVNSTTVSSNLGFAPTGDWTIWKTVSVQAALNAGANKVRATATGTSGPNIDHLQGP
jgi:glucose/arabinose dehydrogenase